ncbi:MAG: hypothetical protein F9K40_16485, partial [Kofleriaceae bacterium]
MNDLTFETPALVGIALAMPFVIALIALADRERRERHEQLLVLLALLLAPPRLVEGLAHLGEAVAQL